MSLAACSDPLASFDRIDDIEAADETSVAQALPDSDDVSPTDGILSRLLTTDSGELRPRSRPVETGVATDVALTGAAVAPIATDDALASLDPQENLSAPIDEAVADVSPAKATGIGGWLRRAAAAQKEPVVEAPKALIVAEAAEPAEGSAEALVVASAEEPIAEDTATSELIEPEKRRGLLGILQPVESAPETVRTASLAPELIETPEPRALAEPKKRRGLFGRSQKPDVRSGPDARSVAFGTVLPYGEIARMCDVNNSNLLGKRVAIAPEKKGRGFSLYDSAPDSAGPRTFYVTGFTDNCARQFTAALAVFGSPETHEQLRYGLPSKSYPYSTTDEAYEKVKSSVCKVGKGEPCGSKISTLERNTAFISTYEKFTDNARWSDILLHDGVVVAAAIKVP